MRPAELHDDVTGEYIDRATPPVAVTIRVGTAPEAVKRGVVLTLPLLGMSMLLNYVASLKRPEIEVTQATFARLLAADPIEMGEAFACVRAQRRDEMNVRDPHALTKSEALLALRCGSGSGRWPCALDPEEVAALGDYIGSLDARDRSTRTDPPPNPEAQP